MRSLAGPKCNASTKPLSCTQPKCILTRVHSHKHAHTNAHKGRPLSVCIMSSHAYVMRIACMRKIMRACLVPSRRLCVECAERDQQPPLSFRHLFGMCSPLRVSSLNRCHIVRAHECTASQCMSMGSIKCLLIKNLRTTLFGCVCVCH